VGRLEKRREVGSRWISSITRMDRGTLVVVIELIGRKKGEAEPIKNS